MYFNYEKEEKGFKPFYPSKQNVKQNRGKKVVYLIKQDIDLKRGYYFPRIAKLEERHYSQLFLDNYGRQIDVRDIVEIGIEI